MRRKERIVLARIGHGGVEQMQIVLQWFGRRRPPVCSFENVTGTPDGVSYLVGPGDLGDLGRIPSRPPAKGSAPTLLRMFTARGTETHVGHMTDPGSNPEWYCEPGCFGCAGNTPKAATSQEPAVGAMVRIVNRFSVDVEWFHRYGNGLWGVWDPHHPPLRALPPEAGVYRWQTVVARDAFGSPRLIHEPAPNGS